MIIQFCGLSGSGKTTLAQNAKRYFAKKGILLEVMDADDYRRFVWPDLGFSKEDRNANIRRLGFIASRFSANQIVPIICAINPYEDLRNDISIAYPDVKMIYIKCNLEELIRRDTKGLYRKAMLPDHHPEKIFNLTGYNDSFEVPESPDLIIETDITSIEVSTVKLIDYIKNTIVDTKKSNL